VIKLPILADLCEPFIAKGLLKVVNVYIREAHPTDGWELDSNQSGKTMKAAFGTKQNICVKQTHQLADRIAVATAFLNGITGAAKRIPLVVDDPATNALDLAYDAPPERIVVVQGKKVIFYSGQGPFQYSLKSLAAFLHAHLGDAVAISGM